ncbi:MAG TPA: molybdenum cofactor guanylyltransferase [Rhizomicrobium sp.]|jgi:molybdopterin-guanine dinucleotide biosynthesis protein A|nr:molybdenum cofactor guanylyltransferase [Rhizomicrobium sp.]
MGADTLTARDILGVVLAGGRSRRFGCDKAIAQLDNRQLIEHVVARAKPQVGILAISGRDYGLGLPLIPDAMASEGPLTGVVSAMQWAETAGFSAVATFSCDTPFFPADLVARLAAKLTPASGCSFASTCGTRHPVFALWRISVLGRLQEDYTTGIRSLMAAQDRIGAVATVFDEGPGPGGDMFFNINSRAEQALAQAWLAAS